ncbi:bifunctional 4-hydroxy-2-oxoglutarate aldolase/2-dehydro-3-deoxy-phosphogluconate aldolase [Niallia taxi]|uniref:bifunctional 4-hydroxy-2-oxoglutarate aldolase/2-dehydro-3-deoxy-phosphogluconate aldolase n=1 Tax=Niallia TaxID=2837506 RepID=UPI0030F6A401
MNKANTLSVLTDCGVVAVIRADTPEEAVQTSIACVDGGITGIEVTFTVKDAEKAIRELVESYRNNQEVVIGAGTVLDGHTARLAIMAGAQFIVSPCFDKETAKLCNLYQIPYMPGCMTVTEMKQALEYGADIIKLFPGSAFGPDYVKAVKAPLPHVNIMPTGGVSLENIHEWIENGCAAVGVGGNLVAPAKEGNFEQVTAYARQYVEKVKEARGKAQ